MSDLDLTIELDPAPAATAAKKVVDEFSKAEDQGIKAKQAYESLSQTFRRLGQAMLEESRRGGQAIDNLGSALARIGRLQALDAQATRQAMAEKSAAYASFGEQLARVARLQQFDADAAMRATRAQGEQAAAAMANVRGFDGLARAIAREQQVLERLHGPMRQAQEDLQAIDALYRRGAISAQQYASEVNRVTRSASDGSSGGGLGAIASGVRSLNMKQAAQGASQAFELLNSKLQLTDNKFGEVAGSAIKFGALGMQIAGPWGAAVGALVGITASLGDELYDWIDGGAHAKRMKALQEEIAVNQQLAKSYREITESIKAQYEEDAKRDTEAADKRTGAITTAGSTLADAQAAANEKLRELKVALYSESRFGIADAQTLTAAQQALFAATKEKNGVSHQEILLSRQVRDATIEQQTATKSYGKTLADIRISEAHRLDAQADLKKALDDGALSLKEYNRELAKTGGEGFDVAVAKATLSLTEPVDNAKRDLKALDEAWSTAVDHSSGSMAIYKSQRKSLLETISGHQIHDYYTEMLTQIRQPEQDWTGRLHALDALLKRQRISVEEYSAALRGLNAAYAGIDLSEIGLGGQYNIKPGVARQNTIDADTNSRFLEQQHAEEVDRAARYGYAANGAPVDRTSGYMTPEQAIASANAPAKELEEHVTSINDLFADQLVGSAKTFSDTLVDAANGADVSWSNFGRNLLVTFEKMITQALVLKAITGSVTGTKGTDGWGGLIGALGFSTGGDALAGVSGLHRIPAAATGYDGIVPGAGSTDSRLAMIRVTPGESIHVRTPEQRRAASTPSGSTTIQNVFQFDKRSLLPILSSPDGKAAIVNVVRENPELMRALLR